MPAPEPDLARVCEAFNELAVAYVLIGGFAVIANGYVRATRDVDLLVPDDQTNTGAAVGALGTLAAVDFQGHAPEAARIQGAGGRRFRSEAGDVDLIVEGEPPLDFASVAAAAFDVVLDEVTIPVCDLVHLAAFKRLARRPQDRADLAELEALHGPLPAL